MDIPDVGSASVSGVRGPWPLKPPTWMKSLWESGGRPVWGLERWDHGPGRGRLGWEGLRLRASECWRCWRAPHRAWGPGSRHTPSPRGPPPGGQVRSSQGPEPRKAGVWGGVRIPWTALQSPRPTHSLPRGPSGTSGRPSCWAGLRALWARRLRAGPRGPAGSGVPGLGLLSPVVATQAFSELPFKVTTSSRRKGLCIPAA